VSIMKMNRFLALLAVGMACAALWVTTHTAPQPRQLSTEDPAAALGPQIERLRQQVQVLQAEHDALLRRLEALERNGPSSESAVTLSELRQKLEALDQRQAESTRTADKYGVLATMEKELLNAYATLMDTNRSVAARVKQSDLLKRYGYLDAKAVNALMETYKQTASLEEKSGVLRALAGVVKTPEFRDQILTELNGDIQSGNRSAAFRYFAIEALEPMLPDPTVQQWLSHLAQSDPNPKLANRAGQAVGLAPPPSGGK